MNVISNNMIALDCDGVVCDFSSKAEEILGMPFDEHAAKFRLKETWRELRHYRSPEGWGFYESLDFMPDAHILLDATKHIPRTLLTGCPFGDWGPKQKQKWRYRMTPDIPMITCMASDKHLHMTPGDVLIDDREKHRAAWENAGGIWITHVSAEQSVKELMQVKPEWFNG
jgi:hypothetical protein